MNFETQNTKAYAQRLKLRNTKLRQITRMHSINQFIGDLPYKQKPICLIGQTQNHNP